MKLSTTSRTPGEPLAVDEDGKVALVLQVNGRDRARPRSRPPHHPAGAS